MLKHFSKTVSFTFHPVFMPLAGIFVILLFSHLSLLPQNIKSAILWMVFLTTVVFPLAFLPLFYYQKVITGITISERRERLIPQITTTVFYFFCFYLLHKTAAPLVLQQYILAASISLFIATLINIKWKISNHMIGIGGFIGLLSALAILYNIHLNNLLMMSIFLAGLIGSVRLYLEEHDPTQIYAGFMIGFMVTSGVMLILNLS